MVRTAEAGDLDKILAMAQRFADISPDIKFNEAAFLHSWTNLLGSGMAQIFMLGEGHGMLGAMVYPDINSGEMVATELFWWVDPEHRGNGKMLVDAYEEWARDMGAQRAIMVHLSESMPERLKKLYIRRGYSELETHYIKEL